MMQRLLRPLLLALLALTIPAFVSAAAAAPASVKVRLTNKGGKDRILMSTRQVKAGPVEFHIKNISKTEMHEFLVTRWTKPITALPYNKKKAQVMETDLPHLAGVEGMKPGAVAILRLPLKPGCYVVFCDQPGHYKDGMEARFVVKG
ncbi:MAG: hypothetical protein P8Y71_13555 [Pseudolabrys sp.]|jgi:uncharacterized cupredoxin-like copper-binding protein